MERIKNNTIIDILLISILGFLSITWFKGNFIINLGDFCLPLSRISFFYKTLFLWDHSMTLGYPAPGQLAFLVPYSLYALLTEIIGISLVVFEKSLFYFWFTVSGLSMYYLCSVLQLKRLTKLVASFFYMMNPYSLQIPWHLASGLLLSGYTITPVILGLFIKSLDSSKTIKYIIILAIIWFVLGAYSYVNPAVLIVHWVILFSYLFYYLLINRKNRINIRNAAYKACILIFLWILLNSFWFIPYVMTISQQAKGASSAHLGFISNFDTFKLNSANLLGALRLGGLWSLQGKWEQAPYYVWAHAYSSTLFILISFLIPFFVFLPLIVSDREHKKRIMYFGMLAVIGLFLVKGAKPPLTIINIWLYKYIPFLGTAFRANIQKWGLVTSFAYSVLLGTGISIVFEYLKNKFNRTTSAVFLLFTMILLFVVYAFPFWNGQIVFEGGGIIPSARTKIPSYYYDLKKWTQQQKGEWRLFSLPLSRNSNAVYSWGKEGYAGADIIRWFSDKPVIYANTGMYYEIPSLIAEEIERYSASKLENLFLFLNVKYILVHRDINWKAIEKHGWWINHNPDAIEKFAVLHKDIKLEKNFGTLDLYKIPGGYFLPLIYASTNPILIKGNIDSLSLLANTDYLVDKPVLFFAADEERIKDKNDIPKLVFFRDRWRLLQSSNNQQLQKENQELRITFKMINPTKYYVKIEGAREPFWLVFLESFNNQWKLYRSSGVISESTDFNEIVADYPELKIKEAKHLIKFTPLDIKFFFKKPLICLHQLVNGYANGWYIGPQKLGLEEDFSLVIYFLPQSLFYAGLFISALTFTFCSGYLFLLKRRRK